jgi:hypothetical protein
VLFRAALTATVNQMTEDIGDARTRAHAASRRLVASDADLHVVEAMRRAEQSLGELHLRLTQQTFYAIDATL